MTKCKLVTLEPSAQTRGHLYCDAHKQFYVVCKADRKAQMKRLRKAANDYMRPK